MNMKRVILSIVLIAACAVGLSAQTHVADSLLPLSPQAASLARYGEYPVSYATGVPDISIPIYTIKLGSYSLPISISYHASGIKVADVASTVGLGWTLNAGGAISRTVEGAPDLRHAVGRTDPKGRRYETYYRDYGNLKALVDSAAAGHADAKFLELLSETPSLTEYDTASDAYTFNFAGKTGTFRYSHEDSCFIPLAYHPFRIQCFPETSRDLHDSRFYIYDTDGVDYHFCETECSGVATDELTTDVSTWYVSRIVTPYGDIKFNYDIGEVYEWYAYSGTITVGEFLEKNRFEYGFSSSYKAHAIGGTTKCICRPKLLTSIEWDGNEVRFHYADDRKDAWKARLTKIEIVNSEGEVLRTVTLGNGSYWGGIAAESGSPGNMRMMLDSLTISDEGVYTFSYQRNKALPEYDKKGMNEDGHLCHTDYWGYYNGRSTRYSVPEEVLSWAYAQFSQSFADKDRFLADAADRTPVEEKAKYGIIREIKYPTGGRTVFEFESNKSVNGQTLYGGLRVKSVSNYGASGESLGRKSYTYGVANATTDYPSAMMCYKSYSLWGPSGYLFDNILNKFITCLSDARFPYNGGNPVVYRTVTETDGEGCKSVYSYSSYPECVNLNGYAEKGIHPEFTLPALNDYGGCAPYLESVERFGSDGTSVTTERYVYDPVVIKDFNVGNRLTCVYSYRYLTNLDYAPTQLKSDVINERTILYMPITAHAFVLDLTAKETTDHTTGVTTRETYTYDSLHRTLHPKTMTMVNSDGRTFTTEYEYAFESDDPVAEAMTDCFYNDAVTGVNTSCGGTSLKENVTRYTSVERDGRPFFYPEYEYESVLGGALNEVVHYCDYDTLGNPRTVIANRADTASVVWGYGSRYPVARVLGMAYGSLPRQAVSALESAVSQSDVLSALASLRVQLSGRALVSGWSHRPLFGVSSAVAANGYAVNYGYTDGGRLSSIADADGIKNLYSYHYGGGASSGNYVESVRWNDMSGGNNATSRQYYDGLGRPSQTVDNAVGASGKPVRTLREYDLRGRERRGWLPAVGGAMGEVSADEFARLSGRRRPSAAHVHPGRRLALGRQG